MLKVNELSKSYDDLKVLDNVSFSMSEESLVVVGQSGMGKSSLLRIIAGLLDSDQGQVYLSDRKILGPKRKLVPGYEEIQLVHQDLELHPFLTLREAIKANLAAYTEDYQEQRIEELLILVGLEGEGHKYPREVSGGQRQKVAIAAALANEPTLLLLDEPFSNLDPFSKTTLLQHIKVEVKKLGTAVIMVTHDTKDAIIFADRIFVLRNGRIVQEGTPEQIYFEPQDEKVARFFGPMNILSQADFLKQLGIKISKGKSVGIRPEFLVLAENGLEVSIKSSLFLGDRFLNTATIEEVELLFYSNKLLEPGSRVFLKLQGNNLTYL